MGISLYPLRPEKEHSLHDFLPRGLPHQQAVNVESTAAKRAVAEYALLGGGRFSRSVGRTLRGGGKAKKIFQLNINKKYISTDNKKGNARLERCLVIR